MTKDEALQAGRDAMCPGCMFDGPPKSFHGAATHTQNGRRYECHASEAWEAEPGLMEPAD